MYIIILYTFYSLDTIAGTIYINIVIKHKNESGRPNIYKKH
jgi:hypothetical protein